MAIFFTRRGETDPRCAEIQYMNFDLAILVISMFGRYYVFIEFVLDVSTLYIWQRSD